MLFEETTRPCGSVTIEAFPVSYYLVIKGSQGMGSQYGRNTYSLLHAVHMQATNLKCIIQTVAICHYLAYNVHNSRV